MGNSDITCDFKFYVNTKKIKNTDWFKAVGKNNNINKNTFQDSFLIIKGLFYKKLTN